MERACDEVISWLDDNQNAEKEDLDEKYSDLEGICQPIIARLYQDGGAGAGEEGEEEEGEDWDGHSDL